MRFLMAGAALAVMLSSTVAEGSDWHPKAIASCEAKLKSGQFIKRVEFAACVNGANIRAWNEDRTPHRDILNNATAQELVAAEAFDRGRMTEIEYAAARARIKTEIASEFGKREKRDDPIVIQQSRRPINCFAINNWMTTCH
jgi:hypothetical protein